MRELIACMEPALISFSQGHVRQPVRTVIEVEPKAAYFATMPAYSDALKTMGAKLVTIFNSNSARGLPSHLATILLHSAASGELLSILDGRLITEARTAAVSAVAARHLALHQSSVLAILGSGVQATSHYEAIPLVRGFSEVRCWSPTSENLRRFVSEHRGVSAAASAEAAVDGADVVVLATASTIPVIRSAWVKRGCCVLAVGACRPTDREMDSDLVARSRLIVDSRASALRESGDILIPIQEGRFDESHIDAELGEVAAGTSPGRRSDEETVIFKSLGLAIEDVAAAHLIYQRALDQGRGVNLA